jgi:hypothetical protein
MSKYYAGGSKDFYKHPSGGGLGSIYDQKQKLPDPQMLAYMQKLLQQGPGSTPTIALSDTIRDDDWTEEQREEWKSRSIPFDNKLAMQQSLDRMGNPGIQYRQTVPMGKMHDYDRVVEYGPDTKMPHEVPNPLEQLRSSYGQTIGRSPLVEYGPSGASAIFQGGGQSPLIQAYQQRMNQRNQPPMQSPYVAPGGGYRNPVGNLQQPQGRSIGSMGGGRK